VLTSNAVGFIRARSVAPTIPRVASTRRMWRLTMSQDSKKASLLSASAMPSASASAREASLAQTTTFIPKAGP
jgi:hypothetical protein